MKQREMELILRTKGNELGVLHILSHLAEEIEDVRLGLKEAASLMIVTEKVVSQTSMIQESMRDKIDSITKRLDPGDERMS